jgi:hypothetical protein
MTGRPAWAEVSLATLRENFRAIRGHVGPGVEVVAVLKANAYGHGAEAVARALAAEGAAWFGVTSAAEALPLRRAGFSQPVLLFSGFWPGEEELLASHGLVPFLFDAGQLERLEDYGWGRQFGHIYDTFLALLGDTWMAQAPELQAKFQLDGLAAFQEMLTAQRMAPHMPPMTEQRADAMLRTEDIPTLPIQNIGSSRRVPVLHPPY